MQHQMPVLWLILLWRLPPALISPFLWTHPQLLPLVRVSDSTNKSSDSSFLSTSLITFTFFGACTYWHQSIIFTVVLPPPPAARTAAPFTTVSANSPAGITIWLAKMNKCELMQITCKHRNIGKCDHDTIMVNCSIRIPIDFSYLCAQGLQPQQKEKAFVQPDQFQFQILQL